MRDASRAAKTKPGTKSGKSGRPAAATKKKQSKRRPSASSARLRRKAKASGEAEEPLPEKQQGAKRGAAARRTEMKKRKREQRRRLRSLRGVALLVLAVLLAAGAVWGVSALIRSPLFAVTELKVRGNQLISSEEIRRAAAVSKTDSLILLSKAKLTKRLQSNPWIESLAIKKILPHTVELTVTERRPLATVALEAEAEAASVWLLSDDGLWLGSCDTTRGVVVDPEGQYAQLKYDGLAKLIRITQVPGLLPRTGRKAQGEVIRNVVSILKGLSDGLRARVLEVQAPAVVKTSLRITDGIEIDIGSATDIAAKDQIIREVLRQQKGKVVLINVRSIEKPTWRGLSE
jgi:cell division protein FtsQ